MCYFLWLFVVVVIVAIVDVGNLLALSVAALWLLLLAAGDVVAFVQLE